MTLFYDKFTIGKRLLSTGTIVVHRINKQKKGFQHWLSQGQEILHPKVQDCLQTMHNWQDEICNYHQLRFTNAAVEGKNNLIKALQRRHFFTRNPQHYKETILLECNAEWIEYGS